ncbi:MAG TPA: carboxypeptidase regulatory-like domain-containing protein [Streptosporangiaceae bacterium]|nr:carboxypeptidase regulatory-like domain-containing protein [Streptosporangiaceae bacterium]
MTAVLATTSLAIGLLGALAPAGQASATHRPAGPAVAARVPAGIHDLRLLADAARSASRPRPAAAKPAASPTAEVITGLVKALSGAPLTGVTLPPLIKWRLSQFRAGSNRPLAGQATASTGSITGTVTGDNRPLDRICVIAEAVRGSGGFKRTITNRAGRYQVKSLKPGSYRVTFLADGEEGCSNRGNWVQQWYRGTDSPGPTRKVVAVPVRAGKATRGINARLHHGAEISGIIRDTSGQPLSGICAATFSFQGPDITLAETQSGKDGRYTLGGLFPGSYTVFFLDCHNKGNYAFLVWRHAQGFGSANRIKVVGKQNVTGINPVMLPGATVTGTVRAGNTQGKPVSGVCVTIDANTGFSTSSRTGKTGHFELKGFGTGSYFTQFDPTCDEEKISPLLGTHRKVKVTGGHVGNLGNVPLRVGARLTGVVRDSSGNRMAGACVQVDDDSYPFSLAQAKTGPNGTYTVVGIEPGKFAVRFSGCATAQSVLPQFYNDKPTRSSANKIRFRAGKTVSGIDATMQPAGTLTGLVTDRSGHPLAHVCVGIVTAESADLVSSGFQASVMTKPNGRYRLRNVIPGPYQVSIGCYGGHFAGRWFNNQQDSARGGFLSIPAGLVTTLNGTVGQPGGISGIVTDRAGKPVNNICVSIVDQKTKTYINIGGLPDFGPPLTEHGRYHVRGLTPGRYLVNFSSCTGGKFTGHWYRNGTTLANATPVTVRPGRTTTGINQVLVQGGSISGNITGPSGRPAKNICLESFDSASLGFGFAITNKTGHYTMSGLDSGHYSVYAAPCSAHDANLGAVFAPKLVKVTKPRAATLNLSLKAGGTISGRVLGTDGKTPQPSTCVVAVPSNPDGSLQSVMAKADGSYVLPQITPGKYRVYFGDLFCTGFDDLFNQHEATTAPQWFQNQAAETAATTITVTSGHTNTGINATMHPYGTISGTIRTQSNRPVSGECVTAVPTVPQFDQAILDQPIPNVSAITTATGRYTLIALPGQYKIEFSTGCGDSGFATQWWKGASSAKTAQLVTVAYGTTTGVDATLHH